MLQKKTPAVFANYAEQCIGSANFSTSAALSRCDGLQFMSKGSDHAAVSGSRPGRHIREAVFLSMAC